MSISPIRFQIIDSEPQATRADCLVVGITPGDKLSTSTSKLNRACGGMIRDAIRQGDIHGKAGETLYLYPGSGTQSKRILLVGCGKNNKRDGEHWDKIINAVQKSLNQGGSRNAAIYLTEHKVKGKNEAWQLQEAARIMANASYKRGELKSTHKKPENPLSLARFHSNNPKIARAAVARGKAVGEGMTLARRLGDLPANVCTPSYLATQARALARKHDAVTVKVLNEAQMRKLGMGSLLSVAAGSDEPARLIVINYQGGKKQTAPVALVGKGVTFDTGGISLKPGAAMDEMKYDMCGAASVLGTMSAIAAMKLPVNVVGVVPATENMPNGHATKPGDIVTSMSGKTIEILNTDAEGRLILCDAITYVQRQYKPELVIDIATLTGAVIVGLGTHISGLMSNNDKLAKEVLTASDDSGDQAWQLPMDDKFQKQLASNFADMANIGGRSAGTITAACFLSRFVENDTPWAHLDIAGTAWTGGTTAKGASGRPVPLLSQFLLNRCS